MSDEPQANPGYAAGELAKALQTHSAHSDANTRQRAEQKANSWLGVLAGMASGLLNVGSRQPVAGLPVWVTPEVLRGGFASGKPLAGGGLLAHEVELARRLHLEPTRWDINQYFVSAPGLQELQDRLTSGCYRVDLPEEAALLVIAWLGQRGEVARAQAVLQAVAPFFDRLRFYPVPLNAPSSSHALRLHSAEHIRQELRKVKPRPRRLLEKEVLQIWAPLQDRLISLWLDTVEGQTPTLEGGRTVGGWPCQSYPPGWSEKARALLLETRELTEGRPLWQPRGDFQRLLLTLDVASQRPQALTGREVGFVRLILACFASKRGLPGSEKHSAVRRAQARQAALPHSPEFARLLLERLQDREELDRPDQACLPVTADEASRLGLPAGTPIPQPLHTKVLGCWRASAEELIGARVIRSGEMLARMVPQMARTVHSEGFDDPVAGRLYEALYLAFSQRRSLLLLSLQHQVRLTELPWADAMVKFRVGEVGQAARQTLIQVAALCLGNWPFSLLPNKLVRELGPLCRLAEVKLPLVEEVAADIFMGTFSEKFLLAAQQASALLKGTLYASYYGLPYPEVEALNSSPGFADICRSLAGVCSARSVVDNGKVIEQAQLLTTHNLAVLWQALDLSSAVGPPQDLARRCFDWVCREQRRPAGHWRGNLKQRSRCAYAWRHMVFFLALLPHEEFTVFLAWATPRTAHPRLQKNVAQWLKGLSDAGEGRKARPLLGWVSKADLQSAES